jgi:D-hydroxyproline dehydrogenase subunit beta
MENHYDIAVVGAGIVGLAIALEGARQGKKVVVFERSPRSMGASVRNFGLVWPLGQPAGPRLERALRSRATWLELKETAGLPLEESGSLTLAYHDDEVAVLEEFVSAQAGNGYDCTLLTPEAAIQKSDILRPEGLKAALWSRTECTVSPRQALPMLAAWLEKSMGVDFHWGHAVTHVTTGHLSDFYEMWKADAIYICGGQDFETLYPRIFRESGITRCKLQMMRTQAQSWRLGPSLCAGLTLRHYDNFADCPSLTAVNARYDAENPLFRDWGIHVLLSQNAAGELIIGDSHEYGWDVGPFDRAEINDLILEYLRGFVQLPDWHIAESWHGIYPKINGQPHLMQEAEPGVFIVNGLGGAGMTLSFGLAQELIDAL